MPHSTITSTGIASVDGYTTAVQDLLQRAREVKQHADIEPALKLSDFQGAIEAISGSPQPSVSDKTPAHYAAIETALRDISYDLLANNSIDQPSFNEIWNLLDVVLLLSDNDQCEPSLVFWLVEELLDSQTIQGCRRIFDYLDSRRERLMAKHFKSKNLIILRACNELLRRLSRAEDTVFCGRVFIFLFQSFPLGDRSSVNLRGEYHVDNVTVYDDLPARPPRSPGAMDVDLGEGKDVPKAVNDEQPATAEIELDQPDGASEAAPKHPATTSTDKKGATMDVNTLYPIFWSLQEYFSNPTKLFDLSNLKEFKAGLQATLDKFKEVHIDLESRGSSKAPDESKRGTKRKREGGQDMASSFNPKYLTNRDLFELEISDLAFRRHILVQALIIIDFLLSLTTKAKAKLESMKNKSVLYDFTLEEEDTAWVTDMRTEIANYLQQGPEGRYYYRMVDTVLSRDKNWVHWKAESCPAYQRDCISTEDYIEARNGAQKACANKRIRATPLGSLDLGFLSDGESTDGLVKFMDTERYTIPAPESFQQPIADDEFDAQTAKTEEDKQLATNARASKLWRTLRIASKNKFGLFDKIDDGNNLRALFEVPEEEKNGQPNGDGDVADAPEIKVETAQELSSIGGSIAQ